MRMNLKILLVSVVIVLFINPVHAQKKCKYKYEIEDAFTGVLSKGTSTPIFPPSVSTDEHWYIGFNREGDNFSIVNDIQLSGEMDNYVNIGDSIMFKAEDGSVITCYAIEKTNPRPKATKKMNQSIFTTEFVSIYHISEQQLEKFADSQISIIRLHLGDEVIEQPIKSKHAQELLSSANCILQ
jgi:hypothetical protein